MSLPIKTTQKLEKEESVGSSLLRNTHTWQKKLSITLSVIYATEEQSQSRKAHQRHNQQRHVRDYSEHFIPPLKNLVILATVAFSDSKEAWKSLKDFNAVAAIALTVLCSSVRESTTRTEFSNDLVKTRTSSFFASLAAQEASATFLASSARLVAAITFALLTAFSFSSLAMSWLRGGVRYKTIQNQARNDAILTREDC